MKFLLDQDVYAVTARFLTEQGRIFITRDRDFGNLVFVHGAGGGVIYMRMLPSTMEDVHTEMKKIIETYDETELARSFVVVEQNRHRIRRIEQSPLTRFRRKTGLFFYPQTALRPSTRISFCGCGRK